MASLPHQSLLTALGEVSAAFVGFSLVVGILQVRRGDVDPETSGFFSMRDLAEIGLIAVGASLEAVVDLEKVQQ